MSKTIKDWIQHHLEEELNYSVREVIRNDNFVDEEMYVVWGFDGEENRFEFCVRVERLVDLCLLSYFNELLQREFIIIVDNEFVDRDGLVDFQ